MKGCSRTTVMFSAALLLLIALAGPAPAGGSWLRVSPRAVVRQGSQIRLTGTFCDGAQARVSAGPWFAYLEAHGSGPIFVGKIGISENHGNSCEWRVRSTLRVPFAAPGVYWLQVCDRGCTQGVGDLVGAGRLTVVSSAPVRVQARQAQKLRAQLREARRERLRRAVLLDELEADRQEADGRIAELREHLGEVQRLLASERDETAASAGVLITVALTAAIGVFALRRRRSRVVVPDTPAELLERELLNR